MFLDQLEALLERFQTEGPGAIVSEWTRHSSFAEGRHVEVVDGFRTVEGTTRGLNPFGALRVETGTGRVEELYSGEVRQWN